MHLTTLKEIFSILDGIPEDDFEESKSSQCVATLVQTLLEVSSLATVTISQYEETVGEPDKTMKIIGLTAFSVGFVFSRVRDWFNAAELNRLQLNKEVKRLNGLRRFEKDIESLLTIFQAHEDYRQADDARSRSCAFNAVLQITKYKRGQTLGMDIDEIKQNLALAPDADIQCMQHLGDGKRAVERANYLRNLRKTVARKIRKQTTKIATQDKYSISEARSRVLHDSPTYMDAVELESASPKSLTSSTCSHAIVAMKDIQFADESLDPKPKTQKIQSGSSFSSAERKTSHLNLFERQRVKEEYKGQRNRTCDWAKLNSVESESSRSSGTGAESDSTVTLERDLTDLSASDTEYESSQTDLEERTKSTTTLLKEVVIDGESSEDEDTVDSADM